MSGSVSTGNSFIILLVIIAIAIILFIVGYNIVRNLWEDIRENILRRKNLGLVFYEVRLPKSNDVEIRAAEQMFTGLVGIGSKLKGLNKRIKARAFVSFEVVAFRENIRFYVVCPKKVANVVDRQINGTYPLAEINKVKEYNMFPDKGHVSYASLKLDRDNRIPIQTYEELPVDSLATLTDVFSKLHEGESCCLHASSPNGTPPTSKEPGRSSCRYGAKTGC